MHSKAKCKNADRFVPVYLAAALVCLLLSACAAKSGLSGASGKNYQNLISEYTYSQNSSRITIGIANIHNHVSMNGTGSIEQNKKRILEITEVLKTRGANMVVFPECSLTGYFWEDSPECWKYMRAGALDRHIPWLKRLKAKLGDGLEYIVFNAIRLDPNNPQGKFRNSVFVLGKNFDCEDISSEANEKKHIYDKTFLPGIEKKFTRSPQTDHLVINTRWGRFGFATCYDMCFPEIFREYANADRVEAIIELSSWRGTSHREYPGMDVRMDNYYGYIWELMASSQAAFNQTWVIACNSVGFQDRGEYEFWGGSGIWAPSGVRLAGASNRDEELLLIRNLDIKGQVEYEENDFCYHDDFIRVYRPLKNMRTFTRMRD